MSSLKSKIEVQDRFGDDDPEFALMRIRNIFRASATADPVVTRDRMARVASDCLRARGDSSDPPRAA